jgi:hypothetical protein
MKKTQVREINSTNSTNHVKPHHGRKNYSAKEYQKQGFREIVQGIDSQSHVPLGVVSTSYFYSSAARTN